MSAADPGEIYLEFEIQVERHSDNPEVKLIQKPLKLIHDERLDALGVEHILGEEDTGRNPGSPGRGGVCLKVETVDVARIVYAVVPGDRHLLIEFVESDTVGRVVGVPAFVHGPILQAQMVSAVLGSILGEVLLTGIDELLLKPLTEVENVLEGIVRRGAVDLHNAATVGRARGAFETDANVIDPLAFRHGGRDAGNE